MFKGYTLLELVIIIALLGWMVTLATCFFTSADMAIVRREVDRLYAVILYMQRKAFLERTQQQLIFTTDGYNADSLYRLQAPVIIDIKKDVLGPPSSAQTKLTSAITWPAERITFFPDGTISSGAVYLTTTGRSCAYAVTCDASEVSHVRRYKHENGCWKRCDVR